jgi:hypothetical protein
MKLEFTEQYIDEAPERNYWRGISASLNGMRVFDGTLITSKYEPYMFSLDVASNGPIPNLVFLKGLETWKAHRGRGMKDVDDFKKSCKEIIEEYFNLFDIKVEVEI